MGTSAPQTPVNARQNTRLRPIEGAGCLRDALRHVPISALPKEMWNARLVFHNATFDTKHLLHSGAPLQADKLFCSMLFAGFVARGHPFNNREGDRRPSLIIAAKELLGVDVFDFKSSPFH